MSREKGEGLPELAEALVFESIAKREVYKRVCVCVCVCVESACIDGVALTLVPQRDVGQI